ncbi:hypothetical protein NKDENANG_02814 [Candidatus Entotheonellaceae bacterium PAL068K]
MVRRGSKGKVVPVFNAATHPSHKASPSVAIRAQQHVLDAVPPIGTISDRGSEKPLLTLCRLVVVDWLLRRGGEQRWRLPGRC